MHFDKYGILGQVQPDGSIEGGDSANWQGHYLYLDTVEFPFTFYFEKAWGGYCRHPMPKMTNNAFGTYYKNPWNGCISRDQLTGIVAGVISQKDKAAMFRILIHHFFRLFLFSYNTIHNGSNPQTAGWKLPDITGPDVLAHMLRGFDRWSWIFWPLLNILDLQMLVATWWNNSHHKFDPISYAIKLIISKEHVPSLVSLWSWRLCKKDKLLNELKIYWSGWRDQGFMVDLYSAKLQE